MRWEWKLMRFLADEFAAGSFELGSRCRTRERAPTKGRQGRDYNSLFRWQENVRSERDGFDGSTASEDRRVETETTAGV